MAEVALALPEAQSWLDVKSPRNDTFSSGNLGGEYSNEYSWRRGETWNALRWLEAREEAASAGQWPRVAALSRMVQNSSSHALQCLHSIRGRQADSCEWLGKNNVATPFEEEDEEDDDAEGLSNNSGQDPPIIVSDKSPLDVVGGLAREGTLLDGILKRVGQDPATTSKKTFSPSCFSVVVEVSDFDDGQPTTEAVPSSCGVQQNAALRTNIGHYIPVGAQQLRGGRSTMQEHMTARQDPYVLGCQGVLLYRGPRSEGYPFLEEPVETNVLVMSMPVVRPKLLVKRAAQGNAKVDADAKREFYYEEDDETALVERLNLIGSAALQQAASLQDNCESGVVLVLSPPGCGEGGRHPRDAVANALKHWRKRFARYYRCIVLACGPDEELARHLDSVINRDVYSALLSKKACTTDFANWHWDSQYLAYHINSAEFSQIANLWKSKTERGTQGRRISFQNAHGRRISFQNEPGGNECADVSDPSRENAERRQSYKRRMSAVDTLGETLKESKLQQAGTPNGKEDLLISAMRRTSSAGTRRTSLAGSKYSRAPSIISSTGTGGNISISKWSSISGSKLATKLAVAVRIHSGTGGIFDLEEDGEEARLAMSDAVDLLHRYGRKYRTCQEPSSPMKPVSFREQIFHETRQRLRRHSCQSLQDERPDQQRSVLDDPNSTGRRTLAHADPQSAERENLVQKLAQLGYHEPAPVSEDELREELGEIAAEVSSALLNRWETRFRKRGEPNLQSCPLDGSDLTDEKSFIMKSSPPTNDRMKPEYPCGYSSQGLEQKMDSECGHAVCVPAGSKTPRLPQISSARVPTR